MHALLAAAFTLQELFAAASEGLSPSVVNASLRLKSENTSILSAAKTFVRLLVRDYAISRPQVRMVRPTSGL